jgi:hypothetical protein
MLTLDPDSRHPWRDYLEFYGEPKETAIIKPTSISFLDLPPETRNTIYRNLLILKDGMELAPK